MESDHHDICRVCRSEGSSDRPLFHPCVCMGSIKFIHQDCLLQWLKYSRKEYCELCKHRFSFTPIYSPDMPKRLPFRVLLMGLLRSVGRAVRYWLHYTLVAFAWLGVVPLTACRIYRCLFTGSVTSLLTLPLDMLSTENLASDCFQGCLVVTCTLCAFIGLVWLREQILHGGGPDWLEQDNAQGNQGPAAGGLFAWAQGNNRNRAPNNDQPAAAAGAQEANPPANNAPNEQGDGDGNNDDGDNEADVVEGDLLADQAQQANDQNNAAQDDVNWNPIEWDRAAEELTWERLLGLDGSLVFLEHVFWVVSLNTLFILVFAFCPYHIGQFTVAGLKMEKVIAASQFEGLMTTLIGYIIIDFSLVNLHFIVSLAKLLRPKRILGLCHIVVKVSLLVVVEVGIFPLICGWWLDVCSLSMFDASIKDREQSFHMAPGTCVFIHWLVGMVYVFYFASFILLLREVLRPGVLWFLRNLNDPDFNPIQEMIHLPILRHVRRFLASIVIFGSVVLLMLWAPIQIIRRVLPSFLPYNVMLNSDAPVSELSLELLLLQVVLPALLEQGHTRSWLKGLVKGWTIGVAWLIDIRSYLLGDVTITEEDDTVIDGEQPLAEQPPAPAADIQQEGVGAVHQAMLQGGGPTGFQPYKRPRFFSLRVVGLIVMIGLSLFVASLVCLVIPVWIGRQLMQLWMKDVKIHELYTAACGLYTCWLILRAIGVLYDWLPQGWRPIANRLAEWFILSLKAAIAMVLLLGVIPLMLGVLFELVVVVPLRVPVDQSPVFFPWQDWALGVLHAKIICAITMMGPQWWLKRNMEQVYNMGLRNLNLSYILHQLCIPVIGTLGVSLASPYAVVRTLAKIFGIGFDMENIILRRIYPILLTVVVLLGLCIFHTRQFRRLYEHIKNDRYLVGQRLVNYERQTRQQTESTPTT